MKYTRSLDDFLPSDGWSYTIFLNGLTQKFSKLADVVDNEFSITIVPTDTASLNPGPYRFTERLTNSGTGDVYDLNGDELVINIEPNVSTAAAGAFNTWEERTLAIIEAALSGRLTSDIQSYQIAGRAVTKIPFSELKQIRGQLLASIWRQNHPGQLGVPYKVAFTQEDEAADFPPTWQDVTGLEN